MPRIQRTPFVILGLLGMSGSTPRSGYEIKKVIETVISSFWYESTGQIYPALKRLAADGLIAVRSGPKGARRKTLYAITPKGRTHLRAWLGSPVEVGKPRDELILKLCFGSEAELPALIGHLEAHRDRARATLERCRAYERENAANPDHYRPFVGFTIDAGISLSAASLRWAEESLKALNALKSASSKP